MDLQEQQLSEQNRRQIFLFEREQQLNLNYSVLLYTDNLPIWTHSFFEADIIHMHVNYK